MSNKPTEPAAPAGAKLPPVTDMVAQVVSHPIKTTWTAAELIGADFPAPRWAVPNLLPVGLGLLGGRPKIGKSWLALQIAVAVGTGGMVFDRSVSPGKVLYLALEDSPRRLKNRLVAQDAPSKAAITFHTVWRTLGDGGFVALQEELTRVDYRLAVIDTFSRIAGRADQRDAAEMTMMIGELQALAMNKDMCVLVIDHHRKVSGPDPSPIDDLLESTAKPAVADVVLGLYRQQGKAEKLLKGQGRDVEEIDLLLSWDAKLCCWQLLGNADDVRKDTNRGQVLSAIRDLLENGQIPTTQRIARYLNKEASHISRELGELLATGKVIKGAKQGKEVPYVLP